MASRKEKEVEIHCSAGCWGKVDLILRRHFLGAQKISYYKYPLSMPGNERKKEFSESRVGSSWKYLCRVQNCTRVERCSLLVKQFILMGSSSVKITWPNCNFKFRGSFKKMTSIWSFLFLGRKKTFSSRSDSYFTVLDIWTKNDKLFKQFILYRFTCLSWRVLIGSFNSSCTLIYEKNWSCWPTSHSVNSHGVESFFVSTFLHQFRRNWWVVYV